MKIAVTSQVLTDGSEVFNVILADDGAVIELPALTEKSAYGLAEIIRSAIEENACVELES